MIGSKVPNVPMDVTGILRIKTLNLDGHWTRFLRFKWQQVILRPYALI